MAVPINLLVIFADATRIIFVHHEEATHYQAACVVIELSVHIFERLVEEHVGLKSAAFLRSFVTYLKATLNHHLICRISVILTAIAYLSSTASSEFSIRARFLVEVEGEPSHTTCSSFSILVFLVIARPHQRI